MQCNDTNNVENTKIYFHKIYENTQIHIAKSFENTQIWIFSQLLQYAYEYAYVCCQTTLLGLQKYNNKTKQRMAFSNFYG